MWLPSVSITACSVGLLSAFARVASFSFTSGPHTDSEYLQEVQGWLDQHEIHWKHAELPDYFPAWNSTILQLEDSSILLHVLPTPTNRQECLPPHLNKRLTDWISQKDPTSQTHRFRKIIHLHQDVWVRKQEIVQSRLLVQSGKHFQLKRIFARQTKVQRINATAAMAFLEEHHLWGATRAKYYYGLLQNDEIVAVATFSSRRKVERNGKQFRSHELLRYCAQRDATVVGGISKLCKKFIVDVQPDDIVTVVDRDWGDGSGWKSMGFATVAVMDPLIMAVSPNEKGVRRHLVGAGITSSDESVSSGRPGLPLQTLDCLDQTTCADEPLDVLARNDYYAVYDSGVERLFKIVNGDKKLSAELVWNSSQPKYASNYYSKNQGISQLLRDAASNAIPLDAPISLAHAKSWRSTSGTATLSKVLFSEQSTMDPGAVVEVRERDSGWRTVGIIGSKTNPSIYHGIYKVDDRGHVDPTAIVPEFVKSMAILCLVGTRTPEMNQEPLRFLHFGYGAGALVRFISHHVPGSQHIAIEIDRGVVAASEALVPKAKNLELLAGDALAYGEKEPLKDNEKFDCICIDVFDEHLRVPEIFYRKEFLRWMSSTLLMPDGIVVQNFHSGGNSRAQVVQEARSSYADTFAECCWIESLDSKPHGGNIILMASKSPLRRLEDDDCDKVDVASVLARRATTIQNKYGIHFDAAARVSRVK